MTKLVVIGGGASGMAAALCAKEAGADVTLFEHNDRLGKKLAATGNGRCNLGNAELNPDSYRGSDPSYVTDVFRFCSPADTRAWLAKHGLLLKEKRGYYYPRSEQAASVVSFFQARLINAGVSVHCPSEVIRVKKDRKGGYSITYKDLTKDSVSHMNCDCVILATGGLAGQNLGAGPFGYETARSFGHIITPLFPALVQLVAKDKNLKTLSGVRADAEVTLRTDGEVTGTYRENGEVLFTDYGISGIAVMQLSRYAAEALERKGDATLSLDFFPDMTKAGLTEYLKQTAERDAGINIEEALSGLMPKKLLYVCLLRSDIKADTPIGKVSDAKRSRLVSVMKEFTLPVVSTKDFSMAQVTAGGVSVSGVNADTMESKLSPGLFITGELLDIDGTCGGYNLQFAFATGILAGTAAGNRR